MVWVGKSSSRLKYKKENLSYIVEQTALFKSLKKAGVRAAADECIAIHVYLSVKEQIL